MVEPITVSELYFKGTVNEHFSNTPKLENGIGGPFW